MALNDSFVVWIDDSPPQVSSPEINSTSTINVYSTIKVNASITDTHTTVETVLIEMTHPNNTKENITVTQSGSEYLNQSVYLTQLGNYSFKFFANADQIRC